MLARFPFLGLSPAYPDFSVPVSLFAPGSSYQLPRVHLHTTALLFCFCQLSDFRISLIPLALFLFQEIMIGSLDVFRARMLRSKDTCIDCQYALVEQLGLLV